MMRRYVLIGGGPASIAAAEAIRARDPGGSLILISADPLGYYSRPGLAYLLTGEITEQFLYPMRDSDFRRYGIERVQDRVQAVDPEGHRVILSAKGSLPFDRLLIATGSTATIPSVPGIDLEGVVKLDNLLDARRILALARRSGSAVVVGGGITALELVEGLRSRGVKVHYFLRGDRYWSNVLDEIESQIVERRLQEEGVQIHKQTEMGAILGRHGRVDAVQTTDGRVLKASLVACAIGIQPCKELAVASGLKTDRGILVDSFLRTSHPDIFAAGDVAQVFDPVSKTHVLDSLWGPARDQGRVAGQNMAGGSTEYSKPAAINVTRLVGLTTTLIGAIGRGRDADLVGIARGDSETWRQLPDAMVAQANFQVNRLRLLVGEQNLVGAVVMGDQTLSKPIQHLVSKRVDISPIRDRLLESGTPLADLIADFWTEWRRTHED